MLSLQNSDFIQFKHLFKVPRLIFSKIEKTKFSKFKDYGVSCPEVQPTPNYVFVI